MGRATTLGPFRFGWVSHASSAERLIGVDLLDCAAEFLETQIDHRLTGGAKAWAGSQLAQVCLFDRQPDKVLQALDSGYLLGLAVDLTGEHRRVRAQALQTADRRGEALAAVGGDASETALRLCPEILWHRTNGPAAI